MANFESNWEVCSLTSLPFVPSPENQNSNALLVVLTYDFLQPQLTEINKPAVSVNRLLVKPVGVVAVVCSHI